MRQRRELQPSRCARLHYRLPALLGKRNACRRLPLRFGFRFGARHKGTLERKRAPARTNRRRPLAERHETDRRSMGCRGRLPSGKFRRTLGGMERPLPRRYSAVLARRYGLCQRNGNAGCGKFRFILARRTQTLSFNQLFNEPRRIYAQRFGKLRQKAQRNKRRRQQRRLGRQFQLQLRTRRPLRR